MHPFCRALRGAAILTLAAAPVGAEGWFHEITDEVGLRFTHETGAVGNLAMPEIMAPGVALIDIDGDDDLDVFVTNGSFRYSGLSRPGRPNRLFRADPGPAFADVTDAAGLAHDGYGMGASVGDWNADGFLDLYLTNAGADVLYRNRGDGTFEDVTAAAGVNVDGWSCSAAFLDHDRDGDLDLFVTRYVDFDPAKECSDAAGRPEYCGPLESPPLSDVLLRNEGDGTFTDVSAAAGVAGAAAAGLGVVCADFDGDGWTDVYVANDAYANHFWINQGDGTFFDDALLLGAAFNLQGMAEAGMGVVAADFDRDLDFDLFMTHLRNESNTLYTYEGPTLGFEDRTAGSGLGRASMPTTGFGTVAFDAELDGDLDLFVGNGSVNRGDPREGTRVAPPWDWYAEPNHLYLADGAGTFRLAAEEAGELAGPIEVTRGIAAGDVDSDGDVDLFVANAQGPLRLYRNDAPRQGHWLTVRLVDTRHPGAEIGARVTVHAAGRAELRSASPASSYLSSGDPRVHFGLGGVGRVDAIEVTWSDGALERFAGASVDRFVDLRRGGSAP